MRTRRRGPATLLCWGVWVLLFGIGAGCNTRPVPHLERAMSRFEDRHAEARRLPEGEARSHAYAELADEVTRFRASLEGERELDPDARVRASSDYGGGIGYVRVDRRDVASIRRRADRLLRSLHRYLDRPPPEAAADPRPGPPAAELKR